MQAEQQHDRNKLSRLYDQVAGTTDGIVNFFHPSYLHYYRAEVRRIMKGVEQITLYGMGLLCNRNDACIIVLIVYSISDQNSVSHSAIAAQRSALLARADPDVYLYRLFDRK